MTAVVSDNSPLSYLIQIKYEHCLPALYERVLVPQASALAKTNRLR